MDQTGSRADEETMNMTKIAKMAKKVNRKGHRIYVDENDLTKFYTVKCSNAKKKITMLRSDHDVLTAKRGSSLACMDANCGKRHKDLFPHPVFLIAFTKRACYVVDRISKGGVPLHAVVYEHNNDKDIDIHDKLGPQRLLEIGRGQKTLTLYPPRRRSGGGSRVGATAGPHRPLHERKVTPIPRGAKERAMNAGIAIPPSL